MLIKCPECELQVSDKAYQCPHCGYPMKSFTKNSPREKSRKRMRLPNGFGRITKIKGRVRKPYRAMVTVGKDESGKPIGKLLKPVAYFDTYNDAYAALTEYNHDPFDLTASVTLEEIYEKWFKIHAESVSKSSVYRTKTCWSYCQLIKNIDIREIRIKHLKKCIEEGYAIKNGKIVYPTDKFKKSIKTLLNSLFDYALEYGYVERNYARDLKLKNTSESIEQHITFTTEEMEILWNNSDDILVKYVLIQCYSGLRPSEVLNIEKKNIDLVNHTMVGGMKTEAGRNRNIPIHPLIEPLIEFFMKEDGPVLGFYNNNEISYRKFRVLWNKRISELNLNPKHKLHDGRKHFVTQAKKYGVDEYALKRIIGHTIIDITESIYTERSNDWLYSEICKIEQY